jgi:hypothetical protein
MTVTHQRLRVMSVVEAPAPTENTSAATRRSTHSKNANTIRPDLATRGLSACTTSPRTAAGKPPMTQSQMKSPSIRRQLLQRLSARNRAG